MAKLGTISWFLLTAYFKIMPDGRESHDKFTGWIKSSSSGGALFVCHFRRVVSDRIQSAMQTRLRFIKSVAASGACVSYALPVRAAMDGAKLRIGLISDAHKDVIHDADARLQSFVDAMEASEVDAIFQLGDFCIPKPSN